MKRKLVQVILAIVLIVLYTGNANLIFNHNISVQTVKARSREV